MLLLLCRGGGRIDKVVDFCCLDGNQLVSVLDELSGGGC